MKPEALSNFKGLPDALIVNVLEHVNYKDGVIANRGVVKTTTGSVAILAFDEGQNLGKDIHDAACARQLGTFPKPPPATSSQVDRAQAIHK